MLTVTLYILPWIIEHYCLLPSDPINGHKNCSESQNALFCTLSCEEGFSFAYQTLDDYFCPYNNTAILGYPDDSEYQEMHITNELTEGIDIVTCLKDLRKKDP